MVGLPSFFSLNLTLSLLYLYMMPHYVSRRVIVIFPRCGTLCSDTDRFTIQRRQMDQTTLLVSAILCGCRQSFFLHSFAVCPQAIDFKGHLHLCFFFFFSSRVMHPDPMGSNQSRDTPQRLKDGPSLHWTTKHERKRRKTRQQRWSNKLTIVLRWKQRKYAAAFALSQITVGVLIYSQQQFKDKRAPKWSASKPASGAWWETYL